jgi:predicted type IV restriction endonuclease
MNQSMALQSNEITLGELEKQFKLTIARDPQFFAEWKSARSEATVAEIQTLDRIKSNFENLLKDPPLLEGAVKMVVLAGLLDLAGFYQPPFRIKTETQTSISSLDEDDEGVIIRSAIDVLVVMEKLWVLVIEAKMSNFSLTAALPQALSYMLASGQPTTFGLIANGSDFIFLKLDRANSPHYATSRVFSLLTPGNELVDVLNILKHLGQLIII